MSKVLRTLSMLYAKLPFSPMKKQLIWLLDFYKKIKDKNNKNNKPLVEKVNGVYFELDLNELVDNSLYYQGCFELSTTRSIQRLVKSGWTVMDIGANVGCHTFNLAKLVGEYGKVFAFEPMLPAFRKLKRNYELNNFKNIKLEKLALSNNEGQSSSSFRTSWTMDGRDNKENLNEVVSFTTVDSYCDKNGINNIDFIKIDVDGFEYKVLKGAENMLRKSHPVINMELGTYTLARAGDDINRTISYLINLGYGFFNEETMEKYESTDLLISSIPENATINVVLKLNIK